MIALTLYDEARRALDAAWRVDEVMPIRDRAAAVLAAARIARDEQLVRQATEIRLRAERKAGELLREMAINGERDRGAGGDRKSRSPDATVKTLDEIGVTKSQSSRWQKLADMRTEDFEAKLSGASKEIERALVATKAERQMEKRQRRAARERELGARICAWPTKRYGVIYCDPAWKFETHSENGLDRAADNHYATMTIDAIKALDVESIAADDCVLFMWVTRPFLMMGGAVCEAWGFEYKTCFIWDKIVAGNGYWNLDDAEILLIATRGNVPCPAHGDQKFNAMQHELKAAHSAKPERFAEIIETYFPHLPKIELNRRGPARKGWDAWGNEAEGAEG
ncbi:MT-A70 family methyltransferase [Methylosinus sp. LW4]|uniref:MT-A70 family methyltransferase n=1 Tax=Methylosinus sp. LW4 TaxID=136993 RepID=UPI0003631BE6|nr:MT-A70 family methyltransferase [Methylosinus sp. LW4]